ncbi:hypothetical protein [Streptomyces sp. NBC_00842]|uniref:hypothetical protein n=1 Tax=Streptomyces sp. NBC_00842 TaxID=2975848 RepID=UPI0038667135|nr:hypothetical protein OH821_29995 [Streptomyces sp. NBC_00842]
MWSSPLFCPRRGPHSRFPRQDRSPYWPRCPLFGDVVEVVNSKDKHVAPDNRLGGRNLNRTQWKAGSALR